MEKDQLSRMEEMLGTLIKMVVDSNAGLNMLEGRFEGMEKEMRSMKEEVKGMKDEIKSIKEEVISMKEDVKEIKDGQERQDRILEMLSIKSIETDSYIRDFKRNR